MTNVEIGESDLSVEVFLNGYCMRRKYRTYVEEGGDRQLHCSTGSCQEMRIFDSEKDIREWDRWEHSKKDKIERNFLAGFW